MRTSHLRQRLWAMCIVVQLLTLAATTSAFGESPESSAPGSSQATRFEQALHEQVVDLGAQNAEGASLRSRLVESLRQPENRVVSFEYDADSPATTASDAVSAAASAEGVELQETPVFVVDEPKVAQFTTDNFAASEPVVYASKVGTAGALLESASAPGRSMVVPTQLLNPEPAAPPTFVVAEKRVGRIPAFASGDNRVQLTGLLDGCHQNTSCGCGSTSCGGSCGAQLSCGTSCGSTSCGCGKPSCGGGCGQEPQCCWSAFSGGCCSRLCSCDCNRPRFWARADVLLWQLSGYSVPPLLTQSPAGTPANVAGALGQPATQTLFGNEDIGDDLRVGGRFQTGWWFDECRRIGIQGDFFALGGGGSSQIFNSGQNGFLARPFTNTNPDVAGPDAQLVGAPGLSDGSVRFTTSSNVISASPALRFNLCCCQGACSSNATRTDLILGYRFFRLEEEFASQEILNVTDPLFVDGTNYELNDRIRTQNTFHGVEFGLSRTIERDRWRFGLDSIFAVGEVERVVDLDGYTWIDVPGFQTARTDGGFFVSPNQIGQFRDRDYAVIPQVRADFSYCLAANWRVHAGYTFMYLSSVFRPGSFLTTSFDGDTLGQQATNVGRTQRPAIPNDDLILHGANIGVSYNF